MTQSIMQSVAGAKALVASISPDEAAKLRGREDVLFVDVRDAEEVALTGKVAGAVNVSRGMLEFRADDTTPYHHESFSKDKTIIVYCASGGRAALSGKALLELGYRDVRNLGAFKDWSEAGHPIDR